MMTGDRRTPAVAMMATQPWLTPSNSSARRVGGRARSTTEYPSARRRRFATECALSAAKSVVCAWNRVFKCVLVCLHEKLVASGTTAKSC